MVKQSTYPHYKHYMQIGAGPYKNSIHNAALNLFESIKACFIQNDTVVDQTWMNPGSQMARWRKMHKLVIKQDLK